MSANRHDQMQRVTDVCSDDSEILALSIIRFLAAGYATGDVACWDAAYSGAEHILGPEPGGRLVASLTGLVRAIRAERIDGWMFLPATCCRVTEDETAIVHLMTKARAGDGKSVSKAAADLAKRALAPHTEAASHAVAAVFKEVSPALALGFAPRSQKAFTEDGPDQVDLCLCARRSLKGCIGSSGSKSPKVAALFACEFP